MMRFFVDLYEETMTASTVLFLRRTGPCGPVRAALMERFKSRLSWSAAPLVARRLCELCVPIL